MCNLYDIVFVQFTNLYRDHIHVVPIFNTFEIILVKLMSRIGQYLYISKY